jgi:hypothetical protein
MTTKWNRDTDTHKHTHKAKPATEYEDVIALWNQGISTDKEVKRTG